MIWLKQSTSVVVQFGPFLDKTDGVTLEVGLATSMDNATTGIRLSKNGAALADRGDTTVPAYDAMGDYRITLSTTDTDTLGSLRMIFEEAATCLPGWADFMVVPANVWDSLFGTDKLQADVTQVAGVTQATIPTVAQMDARTLLAADYFDPAADAVANVTLVATVSTLTGHTAQTGDSFALIGTAGINLTDLGGMSLGMKAEIEAEAVDANAFLNDITVADIHNTVMTEAYAAKGATMSLAQFSYMQLANITEHSNSGTTRTVYKLNGTTVAGTFTYDNAATPTAIARTT